MKFEQLFGGFASAVVALSVAGCGSSSNNQLDEYDGQDADSTVIVSSETVDMIQNISSPVEMANEIKGSGVQFQQSILNAAGNENKYETHFKKAANLGVYSADLGYINTFNKNTVVVDYLSSIKRLADGIGVGQFFDFTTLSNLAKNSTNLDSLKQIAVSSFNNIDLYLREGNRSNVSTAIVLGTWVEGIYITCSVIEQTKDKGLTDRLAEQKKIVDILQIVVNTYSRTDADFKTMAQLIGELKEIYKDVRITTEIGEPVFEEVDGMIVIKQNDITTLDYTPEQIASVISKVKDIREFIVK